jgi:hypothetical protein
MNNKKSSGVSKVLVILVGLVVLALIAVSAYLLRGQFSQSSSSASPSPASVVVEESTPTPSPSFDRSKYSVRVLNGTSKSGLASTVSAKLKDLGYTADKTGNATNSATPRTLVRVKADSADLLAQLIKDLSPDYDASSGASLKDADTVDAEVVIGSK